MGLSAIGGFDESIIEASHAADQESRFFNDSIIEPPRPSDLKPTNSTKLIKIK